MASNTTTFPNVTTMRKALVATGELTRDQVAAFNPKDLKEAYINLVVNAEQAPATTPEVEAPVEAPVKKAPANCGCGCGAPTITAKARFLSGHDARFAGQVGRGEVTPADWQKALITPALQAKIDGIRETQVKRDALKAAKAAAKVAAAKAYAEALKA